MRQTPPQKPLLWIASSRKDIREMPEDVQDAFGQALLIAQRGGKPASAKPLKGYTGAGVLEIVEDYDGSAYRAVYAVKVRDRRLCSAHLSEEKYVRHTDGPA